MKQWLGFQSFNDRLGLLVILGVPVLWLVNHWYPIPPEALGATISGWTMVVVFYFRRAPGSNGNPPQPPGGQTTHDIPLRPSGPQGGS